ncbi:lysozyme [Acidobacteria bacterium AB60]|nr:lysozyme [Acidobacteria bacterium AB60]
MAGTSTLREYLVRLGFRVDSQQERNFNESIKKTSKGVGDLVKSFAEFGKATILGLTAAGVGLHKFAEGMAGLHFAAQRTGSSAKELTALEFAFKQVGLSAEDARASVEALARTRRTTPGIDKALGITKADNVQAFVELLSKWGQLDTNNPMQMALRARFAEMAGLNEEVINQLENNRADFGAAYDQRFQQMKRDGFDANKEAKDAVNTVREWNAAQAHLGDEGAKAAGKLLPFLDSYNKKLGEILGWLDKADTATGGWITKLMAVGTVLLPIVGAMKLLGSLRMLGGVAGSLGGGAAAEGGAAAVAGGTGLMALLGPLIPAIVAAVLAAGAIAAIIWAVKHPEQVKQGLQATKKGLDWFDQKLHGLVDPVTTKAKDGFMSSLADMTAKFEGFRQKAYKDVAGKWTIGFGHLIQPGEDFSHADSGSLMGTFQRDLAKSVKHVLSTLKVDVNANQLKALADLDFNIGDKAFDGSTLLKRLNSGDFNGALQHFQDWHYANHKSVQALVNRRAAEAKLFQTPVSGDKSVTLNANSEYHFHGVTDPREAARQADSRQRGTFADLTRNLAGAFE